MRLPPPARRYSPMSVMARTLETVSRPNSRSMAARSSRSSSKISLPDMVADVLKIFAKLSTAVVRELHVNAKIGAAQHGDDLLQRVAVFAAHPHQVTLDGSLRLLLRVLDALHDLARLLN